ncbi:MAG: hypothetical protein JHC33_12270 [Ignisphaera sp.]|nr:hypothetical protein [Ignisphaera sp.]
MQDRLEKTYFTVGLDDIKEMHRRDKQDRKDPHYYNVERTDNPYVVNYTEVPAEELTGNFKISDLGLSSMHRLEYKSQTCAFIADEDAIHAALISYKEQLTAKKSKVIVDEHLTSGYMRHYYVHSHLQGYGLRFTNKGEIALERVYKTPEAKDYKPTKREIHGNLKTALQRLVERKLNVHMTIEVDTKSVYNVLKMFKATFPNLTYQELILDAYVSDVKECEEYWNNPELAKPKPKKAKKEKK